MAANFGFNNLKVEAIGQKVTIPNDDVAKLMYYLSCVDTVINYNEIDRLTDYENYDLLSVDGMAELYLNWFYYLIQKFSLMQEFSFWIQY